MFDRCTNLKYKYGNRYFWYYEHYVDTVGKKCEEDSGIQQELIMGRSDG